MIICSCAIILCLIIIINIQYLQYFPKIDKNSSECVCRNHLNERVDWFIVYKLPHVPKSIDPYIANGTGYIYLDSSSSLDHWHVSSESIASSLSLTGLTLQPLYKSNKNSFMFYNDQPPNHPLTLIYGHSKGVLAFQDETQTGFWLIHSVPHFPPTIEQGYGYPNSGRIFGQTMLCISLNTSSSSSLNSIDLLSNYFLYIRPFVFSSRVTDFAVERYPILSNGIISNRIHITDPPYIYQSSLNISSIRIEIFSKYGLADLDISSALIAPTLRTSMLSETWSNGGQMNLPSNCTGEYHTENIKQISLNFTVHSDHSKWLVSLNDSWICIGDMNRQIEQKRRHGGFACLRNQFLQERFRQLVFSIESCPLKSF